MNFNNLFVVSHLFAYYSQKDIRPALEDYFQSKVLNSLFMADKALLILDDSFANMDFDEK